MKNPILGFFKAHLTIDILLDHTRSQLTLRVHVRSKLDFSLGMLVIYQSMNLTMHSSLYHCIIDRRRKERNTGKDGKEHGEGA